MTAERGDGQALRLEIEGLAAADGLHQLGVADMTQAAVRAEIARQGGAWLTEFPRAVALVHRLQDALVDPLPEEHGVVAPARLYDFHVYRVVNARLDDVAELVATTLQNAGYRALPIPTSVSVDAEGHAGALSHKMVAHVAGLGWIGRSCLFVDPEAGPRVRLATILTDAPLEPGLPGHWSCGTCHVCVNACPAGAFTGRAFDPSEPISARMDVGACDHYRLGMKETTGVPICGVCVAVCPHGRSAGMRPALT